MGHFRYIIYHASVRLNDNVCNFDMQFSAVIVTSHRLFDTNYFDGTYARDSPPNNRYISV